MTKPETLRALLLEAEDVIPERFSDLRQRIADALHGSPVEPGARMVPLVCTCGCETAHSEHCALKYWASR
jgi:hypothetical protein